MAHRGVRPNYPRNSIFYLPFKPSTFSSQVKSTLPHNRTKATTECRATFNHGPNEPARLARQWIKERSISCFCEVWGSYIYRLVWLVWLASASKNPALSVGFMYLAARLARQWIKERSISCFCEVWGSYIYRLVWLASASKNEE